MDPLLFRCLSLSMAVLFAVAAFHKTLDLPRFRTVLRGYRLLPAWAVAPLALLFAGTEGLLAAGWAFEPRIAAVPLASIGLLAGYLAAIGINLARGNTAIDCGCSFAPTNRRSGLRPALLVRNAFLILVAAAALLPVGDRALGGPDYLVAGATIFIAAVLLAAAGQLSRNRDALSAWGRPR